MVKMFYDVETTGVNHKQHCIHQLAGYIEKDGLIVETFDFKIRPHHKAKIEPAALRIAGKTLDQVMAYVAQDIIFLHFKKMLGNYVDPHDKKDKMFLIGFNNSKFDDLFLRYFFELNGDDFFNAWFHSGSIDVMCLAAQFLIDRRANMPSFKLKRVAMELGIEIDKNELHNALYDVKLTHDIYQIVTGANLLL